MPDLTSIAIVAAIAVAGVLLIWYMKLSRRTEAVIQRIAPEDLYARINAHEPLTIVDLRARVLVSKSGFVLPGARVMHPAEAELDLRDTPRGQQLVFYCSCPNDASAVNLAVKLQKLGFTNVRPLTGGFDGWKSRNYPLDPAPAD